MKKKEYASISYIILGIILIVLGCFTAIYQNRLLMRLYDVVGFTSLIMAGKSFLDFFFDHSKTGKLKEMLIFALVGILLLVFTDLPMFFTKLIFAGYITVLGIVKLISYSTYVENKVPGRIVVLFFGLLLLLDGVALIFNFTISLDDILVIIGLYAIALGVMYIIDGIRVILPNSKKGKIKRKIRIKLPIFIYALMPKSALDYLNEHIKTFSKKEFNDYKNEGELEIFVHVSPDGAGTMGHCDICFQGQVLSYGNYDSDSSRLFGALGDGVLFTCNSRKNYINYCLQESNKTIFGYFLKLSDEQIISVKEKIEELKSNAYRWYPKGYSKKDYQEDYASRLYQATKASFYKFKTGRFKTYFVLGTNCVLLADTIVGKTGSDIFDINGIICPGTYYDYLEKEYQRENGLVSKKTIYHHL